MNALDLWPAAAPPPASGSAPAETRLMAQGRSTHGATPVDRTASPALLAGGRGRAAGVGPDAAGGRPDRRRDP